jgi:hypothetical protein
MRLRKSTQKVGVATPEKNSENNQHNQINSKRRRKKQQQKVEESYTAESI